MACGKTKTFGEMNTTSIILLALVECLSGNKTSFIATKPLLNSHVNWFALNWCHASETYKTLRERTDNSNVRVQWKGNSNR